MSEISMAVSNPDAQKLGLQQRVYLALVAFGVLGLLIVNSAPEKTINNLVAFSLIAGCFLVGSIGYTLAEYRGKTAGIKNDGVFFKDMSSRGVFAWILGVLLTSFYVCLYWFPLYIEGLIRLHDPLSMLLRGKAANQWFLYGTFYTGAVLLMGFKFLYKYRHNRYQVYRTISVMSFQLSFAYLIPAFLATMNQPEAYFSYFWPLDSYALRPEWTLNWNSPNSVGNIGYIIIGVGFLMPFVVTPILTYFYGKRWYCSWVCGCGGLAETAGDPFRQLSSKKLWSWKLERVLIYSVLIAVTGLTVLLWVNHQYQNELLGELTVAYKKWYGFFIASMFSGVIGTGFYPIFGNRSWCRFGCPMAALLGIIQRFKSRFRITTNGGQCISCGNCSTYCEMGIDVRAYAQRGQDILRASCVGCGVCSAVCPRGVLRLENNGEDIDQRALDVRNIHVKMEDVKILSKD